MKYNKNKFSYLECLKSNERYYSAFKAKDPKMLILLIKQKNQNVNLFLRRCSGLEVRKSINEPW